MLSYIIHQTRTLTTSLLHRAGWKPELCDKSSQNKEGVYEPPRKKIGGWRTSVTENQS